VDENNQCDFEDSNDDNSVSSNEGYNSDEQLIIKANKHIEQAVCQHSYINSLKETMRSEAGNEHHAQR
jgi:hypothetical protein